MVGLRAAGLLFVGALAVCGGFWLGGEGPRPRPSPDILLWNGHAVRRATTTQLHVPYQDKDWSHTGEGHCGPKCMEAWRQRVFHLASMDDSKQVAQKALGKRVSGKANDAGNCAGSHVLALHTRHKKPRHDFHIFEKCGVLLLPAAAGEAACFVSSDASQPPSHHPQYQLWSCSVLLYWPWLGCTMISNIAH